MSSPPSSTASRTSTVAAFLSQRPSRSQLNILYDATQYLQRFYEDSCEWPDRRGGITRNEFNAACKIIPIIKDSRNEASAKTEAFMKRSQAPVRKSTTRKGHDSPASATRRFNARLRKKVCVQAQMERLEHLASCVSQCSGSGESEVLQYFTRDALARRGATSKQIELWHSAHIDHTIEWAFDMMRHVRVL